MPADFVRAALLLAWMVALSGCGVGEEAIPPKLVLLAPFENQYREIGYNAHTALRLAWIDAAVEDVQYLAVDDGGSVESAVLRMRGLNQDPAVAIVIALGPHATHPQAQKASERPLLLVGSWGHARADERVYVLASRELANGAGDLHMLEQARDLRAGRNEIQFASSGSLPSAEFREGYRAGDEHAPQPNPLAELVYDAAGIALLAIRSDKDLSTLTHRGIEGEISFEDGYWLGAPVNTFRYEGGELVAASETSRP